MIIRRTLTGLLPLMLLGLVGCGSGERTVWVKGTLLKGGSKFELPSDQHLTITFLAIETEDNSGKMTSNSEPYLATYHPDDGTFLVPGKDGSGIPAGKYRVAITSKISRLALSSQKSKLKGSDREKDYLEDKFGPSKSPIVREIKSSTNLTIDLDKPTEGA